MKNIKKTIGILVLGFLLSASFGQTPPPPNNGNGNSVDGNTPVGGGAPISDGFILLISAGLLYLGYSEKDRINSLLQTK